MTRVLALKEGELEAKAVGALDGLPVGPEVGPGDGPGVGPEVG